MSGATADFTRSEPALMIRVGRGGALRPRKRRARPPRVSRAPAPPGGAQTENDDARPVFEAGVAVHAEQVARRLGGEREAFGIDHRGEPLGA
ncbi:hypothetical protein P9869_01910 [Streptomyces ossamyceticus]|nr:hypothetical protein [Streptomyces ossamyceticus]